MPGVNTVNTAMSVLLGGPLSGQIVKVGGNSLAAAIAPVSIALYLKEQVDLLQGSKVGFYRWFGGTMFGLRLFVWEPPT